jgi:glutathione S-transferase
MPPKIKLSYFDIEGIAEKIRLALKIGGLEFEDERFSFAQWPELKAKSPFGALPIMTIDDSPPITQSYAMLRYIGRLTNMYPVENDLALRIDEVCGLQEDLARAIFPSGLIARNPQALGYPSDLPQEERAKIQAKVRAALVADGGDIPRFLGYFEAILKTNG